LKLLRSSVWLAGILILVTATTISFLILSIDPNSYKLELSKLAKENEINLAIKGDLSWSLFPNLALNAGATSISGKSIPDITFSQADFSLDWLALLSRTIRLKAIVINGADITIETTEEAVNIAVATSTVASTKKQSTSYLDLPFEFAVDSLNIKNARLTLLSQDQQKIILKKINLTGKDLNFDEKPFFIELSFLASHPDYPTLININFNSKLKLDKKEQGLTLSDLNFSLNDLKVKGEATLKLASPRELNIRLDGTNLTLPITPDNSIDSGSKNNQSGNKMAAEIAIISPIIAPFAFLQGGEGHIEVNLESLDIDQTVIKNIHLSFSSNNNMIKIEELSGEIFNGTFKTKTEIDFSKTTPKIKFSNTIKNLDINKALSSSVNSSIIQGKLFLDFNGTSQGDTQDQLMENMNGTGKFSLEKLKLGMVNIEQSYCEMASLIEKRPLYDRIWPEYTELKNLSAVFSINEQVIMVPNLSSGLGNLAISGDGKINLKEQEFDALIKANLKGDRTSKNGCPIKSKRNKELPLRCTGSFGVDVDISCMPDKNFIRGLLKETIKEKLFNGLFGSMPNNKKTTSKEDKETKPKDAKEQALDTILKGLFK